jgi:hypothetical protein
LFDSIHVLPWKPYDIRACQGIHSIQGLNAISLYLSFFFFKNKNKNRVRPWIPCLVSIHARGIRAARPFLYRGEVVGRVATLSRFYTCSFFSLRNAYSFYFYKNSRAHVYRDVHK